MLAHHLHHLSLKYCPNFLLPPLLPLSPPFPRPNPFSCRYYIVRLNGLLHADDNVALKEISRQIQASTDAEGGAPDQKERKRVRCTLRRVTRYVLYNNNKLTYLHHFVFPGASAAF